MHFDGMPTDRGAGSGSYLLAHSKMSASSNYCTPLACNITDTHFINFKCKEYWCIFIFLEPFYMQDDSEPLTEDCHLVISYSTSSFFPT